MMDHATGFPIKTGISCLEKYTYHTEPTGSLNYKHNMNIKSNLCIEELLQAQIPEGRGNEKKGLGGRKVTSLRGQRQAMDQTQPESNDTTQAVPT
jgi:hypothetical protein